MKSTNQNRYFKGYQERLQKHAQTNENFYKSLYNGETIENQSGLANKTTAKKHARPSTAKTRTGTKSYSKNRKETLTRPVSAKSLKSFAESARKSESNLAAIYGE